MRIVAESKRRKGGISDDDNKGVGQIKLTADDDFEREFLTSIYVLLGGRSPQAREHPQYAPSRQFMNEWAASFPPERKEHDG